MDKKTCYKCKEEKDIERFATRLDRGPEGRSGQCKTCHSDYAKAHYRKNKGPYLKKSKKHNKRIRFEKLDFIRESKNVPCKDCGIRYPYYVMQFDHMGDKAFAINKAWTKSWDSIKKELAKCEVVCGNCHAERTNRRYNEIPRDPFIGINTKYRDNGTPGFEPQCKKAMQP